MTERVLKPCPSTPNCVSTQAPEDDRDHRIEPIAFETDAAGAMAAVLAAIAKMPRTRIVEQDAGYVHAVCSSRLLRFKDDLEVIVDEGRIDMRSAARLGKGDLGANRRRVQALSEDVRSRL